MVQVKIPWAAWTDIKEHTLSFPDSWNVQEYPIQNAENISDEKVRQAIATPIGTKSISEIAAGKKNAAIVVDDMTRLTPAHRIVPFVIKELESAGIHQKDMVIIIALGAHRPMRRSDMVKKLGETIVNTMNIQNHHPYENLVDLGVTESGTPIHANKTYYEADVKIAVSGVIPHPLAGYGGGAKIILPGVCGIETLEANHRAGLEGGSSGYGYVTKARLDIENTAEKVGLDYSINVILTMRGGIAGIFAGHFIDAHRKAMELGKQVYATKTPPKGIDIGIFNAYPEDPELNQANKCFNFILSSKTFLARKATVLATAACTEGRGYHALMAETGAKLYTNWGNHILWEIIFRKRRFAFFSPNVNKADIHHIFPETTIFSRNWDVLIDKLREIHGDAANVAVFPCSISVPE